MSMKLEKDEQGNDNEELFFPLEIKDVDPLLNSGLQKFKGELTGGFIQIGDNKWFFPKNHANNAKYYYNFKTRSDDVFVMSYPRSGTTWTQEMVWLLSNNLDYKKAKEILLRIRYTFLEFSSFCDENLYESVLGKVSRHGWEILNQQSSDEQRFIKTHLSIELLPPDLFQSGPKIVYVARNPKDVIVSYYHFAKYNPSFRFTGDFPELWSLIRQNLIHWSPYWEHVKEAWNRRSESENFMFIFYEDMQKDLKSTLIKVATFLGQSYTSDQLDELAEHLNFDNFKNNKSVDVYANLNIPITGQEDNEHNNKFVRKGKVGNWKEYFNEELDQEVDEWIAQNLKDSDLRFPINIHGVH